MYVSDVDICQVIQVAVFTCCCCCCTDQLADGEGRASRLVLWSHPGNDVTGMLARSQKVAGVCEKVHLFDSACLCYNSCVVI